MSYWTRNRIKEVLNIPLGNYYISFPFIYEIIESLVEEHTYIDEKFMQKVTESVLSHHKFLPHFPQNLLNINEATLEVKKIVRDHVFSYCVKRAAENTKFENYFISPVLGESFTSTKPPNLPIPKINKNYSLYFPNTPFLFKNNELSSVLLNIIFSVPDIKEDEEDDYQCIYYAVHYAHANKGKIDKQDRIKELPSAEKLIKECDYHRGLNVEDMIRASTIKWMGSRWIYSNFHAHLEKPTYKIDIENKNFINNVIFTISNFLFYLNSEDPDILEKINPNYEKAVERKNRLKKGSKARKRANEKLNKKNLKLKILGEKEYIEIIQKRKHDKTIKKPFDIKNPRASGYKVSEHWVRPHWRNQICGEGKKEHKLIWIKEHKRGSLPAKTEPNKIKIGYKVKD